MTPRPVHVAACVEQLQERLAAPSVKQHLAALRVLFDCWWSARPFPSPASSVRGPRHSVHKGKTPVLTAEEARERLDAIDITMQVGWRDRALIGLMVYTIARIGEAIGMRIEDVYSGPTRLGEAAREKRPGPRDALPPRP